MKTTYQAKNNSTKSSSSSSNSENVTATSVPEGDALVNTYLGLKKLSEKTNSLAVKDMTVDADKSLETTYEKVLKESKTSQTTKKSSKLPVILCAVMFIAIVGVAGFTLITKSNEKKTMNAYNEVLNSINALCTEVQTAETVDTASYREVLATYETEGVDTSEAIAVLDTIDAYITDKGKANSLLSADANPFSEEFGKIISDIEYNADSKYTVTDLRLSIKSIITDVEDKIDNFVALRDEVKNKSEIDPGVYSGRIGSIPWTLCKDEVNATLSIHNAESSYNDAVAALNEVNVPVENEEVKDSKLSKAKRKARDEAIAARDQAVAEATEVVTASEKFLYECYCNLYTAKDSLYGTSELATFKTEWEEAHKVEEQVEGEEGTKEQK